MMTKRFSEEIVEDRWKIDKKLIRKFIESENSEYF